MFPEFECSNFEWSDFKSPLYSESKVDVTQGKCKFKYKGIQVNI